MFLENKSLKVNLVAFPELYTSTYSLDKHQLHLLCSWRMGDSNQMYIVIYFKGLFPAISSFMLVHSSAICLWERTYYLTSAFTNKEVTTEFTETNPIPTINGMFRVPISLICNNMNNSIKETVDPTQHGVEESSVSSSYMALIRT